MASKFAILLDGGFVTKKLQTKLGCFPNANDVQQECNRIIQSSHLAGRDLLRIYFYDASPAKDKLKNPVDGSALDLSATAEFKQHVSLLDTLELMPNFAVRKGELVVQGMMSTPRAPAAKDFVPDLEQEGR